VNDLARQRAIVYERRTAKAEMDAFADIKIPFWYMDGLLFWFCGIAIPLLTFRVGF
jgi:hypothetical protein